MRVHIILFGSSTGCWACSLLVGICANTCERTMPPKTPIHNSVYELRDRVKGLQSKVDQLTNRMEEYEMPAETFEVEILRFRENWERSLGEMRELKDQMIQYRKKTKTECEGYVVAMEAHFKESLKSIRSHQEANKQQRDLLNSFVVKKEKQFASAREIEDLIEPLQTEVAELRALDTKSFKQFRTLETDVAELKLKAQTDVAELRALEAKDLKQLSALETDLAELKLKVLGTEGTEKLSALETEVASLKLQVLDTKPHALIGSTADANEQSNSIDSTAEANEQSNSSISSEMQAWVSKEMHALKAAVDHMLVRQDLRIGAFEEVVFSRLGQFSGDHSSVCENTAISGRVLVSQHAAQKRSRSTSRDARGAPGIG